MAANPKQRTSMATEAMFKLIIIGDSGTGKSCLIARYTKDEFQNDYKVTIGVQFASKIILIDQNYRVRLQIWDTAGQQSFRSIVKSFYRNTAAVVLVYNITNKRSFESLQNWIQQARQNSPQNAIFILMGTHLDYQEQRQVKLQDAKKFMQKQNIAIFFQTSAKTAENVNKAFDEIAKQLFIITLQNSGEQKIQDNKSITLTANQEPKMFGCC